MKTLIKNIVWQGQPKEILIEDGRIQAIEAAGTTTEAVQVIDGQGHTAIPGLVDVHAHFREPGLTYKETISTGSEAAAQGGFTTVLTMPNVKPVIDNPAALKAQIELNQKEGHVKIDQIGALSLNLTDTQTTDIAEMVKAGAVAFSNDGHGVQNARTMLQAMKAVAKAKSTITAHIEDDDLVNHGVMNAGPSAEALGLPGMTGLSESTQLARDLVMVKATGCHYHVAHVSTKESVELVRLAKSQGLPVTAEVTPHHLFLDDSMIITDNPMMKMNPPLRSREDRLALIAGLLDGTIDMIATDHAPHAAEEKEGSMLDCAFGIVGLETAFALVYTHFVASGLVDLDTMLNWMNREPIEEFALQGAGQMRVGDPADIALVDLDHAYNIDPATFASKGKNTPFAGQKVYGQVMTTLVDGKVVYQKEEK
ncbi:dihydroorotase [Eupransor demetentiae]|uniref:Dihydroorotase n=1 Tax=Eupransor demetentiae TaxID=3109584 RepID=A0ABP0ET42_9LACO|nr:Dihydroorotase or related cyclic amidohydrolase (AllB) [Lactobacillaceae bacterium LMG 33000]